MQVERVCTTRPPDENPELSTLLAKRWVYLDRKRVQMVHAGFGTLKEGLYGMEPPLRAQDLRRPAYNIFIPVGGVGGGKPQAD